MMVTGRGQKFKSGTNLHGFTCVTYVYDIFMVYVTGNARWGSRHNCNVSDFEATFLGLHMNQKHIIVWKPLFELDNQIDKSRCRRLLSEINPGGGI